MFTPCKAQDTLKPLLLQNFFFFKGEFISVIGVELQVTWASFQSIQFNDSFRFVCQFV